MINDISAQSETSTAKNISNKFQDHYNSNKYDSIFYEFSPGMQKDFPLEKTVEFLTGLKSQAGQIVGRQFIRFEMGTYFLYKTKFERALFGVSISLDSNARINGLFVKPYTETNLPKIERNLTKLQLPFREEWTVIWGGDTKELNYHIDFEAQKNAFDMVITDAKGNSFKTSGKTNEDYYAFGKELTSPCDGEIVLVVDGVRDNIPGELNPLHIPGNSVIIKTRNNEYLFFAHFKQHSIKVKAGQKIKQGSVLGLCGNSGNSSEPHLHFHIQNIEDMNHATGAKCYFDKILVNGQVRSDYSPIQKDKIQNSPK